MSKKPRANKAGPHASVAFAVRVANYHTEESNNATAPPSRTATNTRSAFRWGCAAKLFEWLDVQERQLYKSQIEKLDIKQFMMLDVGPREEEKAPGPLESATAETTAA